LSSSFINAWEQRKFGDMVNIIERPIAIQDCETYQLVTVRNKNKGVVSRGRFKGKDILVKGYFKLKHGDFLISKRQIVHGASGYVPKELDGAVVSNEYLAIASNECISAEYLNLISQREDMHRLYFVSSYGVDIQKMVFDVSDWKKRLIFVPNLLEQNVIVSLFLKVENLITLHQREPCT